MQLHAEFSRCVRQGIRFAGGPTNPLATDHIIPREHGGTDEDANLETLCARCHAVKTATVDGGFGR